MLKCRRKINNKDWQGWARKLNTSGLRSQSSVVRNTLWQVWSLSLFFSFRFSQLGIKVKSFYKRTINFCISCSWQCLGIFVIMYLLHHTRLCPCLIDILGAKRWGWDKRVVRQTWVKGVLRARLGVAWQNERKRNYSPCWRVVDLPSRQINVFFFTKKQTN